MAFTRRWTSCWRHCAGGPWRGAPRLSRASRGDGQPILDSTPLLEAVRFRKPIGGAVVRWRPDGFGFVTVDGADVFTHVSLVRGPFEGLVDCRVVVFSKVDVAKSTADE